MRRRLFPLAVVALGFSCAREMPPEPNVIAILSTDSPLACVQVGEMLKVGDTFPVIQHIDTIWYDDTFYLDINHTLPWFGVSDAQVTLTNKTHGFDLEEKRDSAGYYHVDSMEFSAGQTWELQVTYSDGRTVNAQTQFPGEFEIVSPLRDSFYLDEYLIWSRSEGALGYIIRTCEWTTRETEDSIFTQYREWSAFWWGTQSGFYGYYDLMWFGDVDSVEFHVAALDSNACNYLSALHRPEIGPEDYVNIEGGWGVFGAQTVVSSPRYHPSACYLDTWEPAK